MAEAEPVIRAAIPDANVPTSVRAPVVPVVRGLTPVLAKGLEFDLVVLVDLNRFGDGVEGAVDR